MIKGVNHVAISTPSIERMLAFYVGQLGAEIVADFAWRPGEERFDRLLGLRDSSARNVVLRMPGGFGMELFEYYTPPPQPKAADHPAHDHGITHICLETDDISGAYKKLRQAGIVFSAEPMKFQTAWATYCRDPDGNILELIEMNSSRENAGESAP